MKNKKGAFIALEGIDGSGKSTITDLIYNELCKNNINTYKTCEPTNSPTGILLRKFLSSKQHADERVIASLFTTDRLYHILNEDGGIKNKINNGITVISDRYYFSSYAYQSINLPLSYLIETNAVCSNILKPDLNIFLDLNPETALKRIIKTRKNLDIYEKKETLMKIRKNYLKAFTRLSGKENILIIDANRSLDIVFNDTYDQISKLLLKRK